MPDALSPWVTKIAPRLTGALLPVIRDELQFAISEFFRESLCWQEEIGPFTLVAGQENVTLDPADANASVIHTLSVKIDDQRVQWRSTGHAGIITLKTLATEGQQLTANVALTPTDATVALPALLTDHYFDAIMDGALGRMYMHPNKPYSSETLAITHLRRARARTREARDAARRGYAPDTITWNFPRFGV